MTHAIKEPDYLATLTDDLRKGPEGLFAVVHEMFGDNPFAGP